ncbi:hypothetical protein Hanom_Chr11g01022211 [Helianthus anomalus]
MGPLAKKDMAIPHDEVLVAAGMSNRWPEDSEGVPVLLFDGQGKVLLSFCKVFFGNPLIFTNLSFFNVEARLYQSAFPTFAGVMGKRPLHDGEEFWLE